MGATRPSKAYEGNRKSSHPEKAVKSKVKALFTDYDGTLSPINISRIESAVPHKTMTALQKISQQIPIAIITTKDLEFVAKKTFFAYAWATLGGLEITIGGVTARAPCLESKRPLMRDALGYAKDLSGSDLIIEEKRDSAGATVAFSVDWRQAENKVYSITKASQIAAYSKSLSLNVTLYEGQPFLDVFPCLIDKGAALLSLKKKLGLQDGILYLGDSAADNAAFEEADIAVGVLHLETPSNLTCDYFVKAEKLGSFLESISKNDFCFNAEWHTIISRDEAMQYLQDKKKHS